MSRKLLKPFTLILTLLCLHGFTMAQSGSQDTLIRVSYVVVSGDTLPIADMKMPTPAAVPIDEETLEQQKEWNRLMYNVTIVMPLAIDCANKLKEVDSNLAMLGKKKDEKHYKKAEEEAVYAQYEERLKKMTRRQGALLIKLVSRETGQNTYDLIKEYKNGISAFSFQVLAKRYDLDLKENYDPIKEPLIEEALRLNGFK